MRLRTLVRDAARCGIATLFLLTLVLSDLVAPVRAQALERFWRTDLNRDRHVDFADLLILIEAIDVPGREHVGDLDGDGATTVRDLVFLLERREFLDDEVLGCPPQDCDVDPHGPGRPGEDEDDIPHPCPGDHDCDGVPDAEDCQAPTYPGDPCFCLNDDGSSPLDDDDDCDGVPNRLDCDSPCYQPGEDATPDCSCEDDDADGVQN